MKALLFLVPVAAVVAGCSTYVERTPVVTYSAPAVVATAPVFAAPSYDSDADGTPNAFDRYPFDSRFR